MAPEDTEKMINILNVALNIPAEVRKTRWMEDLMNCVKLNRVNTANIVIEELNLKLNTLTGELNNMGEKLNIANRK